MGSKSKRDKEKHKKHKKDKHKKHKRHRSSSPSSSDSDDEQKIDVNTQLAMGRAAVRATREILAYNYDLKSDLRELGRQLDSGGALDISGIPDEFLRSKLDVLFSNLVQLKKNPAGLFYSKKGTSAGIVSFLAPILEKSPASLASYAVKVESNTKDAPRPQPNGAVSKDDTLKNKPNTGATEIERKDNIEPAQVIGPIAGPHPGPIVNEQNNQPAGPSSKQHTEGLLSNEEEQEDDDSDKPEVHVRRLGPALPPPELLAAAAQLPIPTEEEDDYNRNNLDDFDDFLVGPAPPEFEEEANLASMGSRESEVSRILKVLQAHKTNPNVAQQQQVNDKANEVLPADAYEVLGIDSKAAAGDIKKRYWRLSLLIHPDKCDHPGAAEAFQAVADAAKRLQDASSRQVIDDRRADMAARREFMEEMARLERERQWRIARGEATAADLAGPVGAGVAGFDTGAVQRETWMTELPAEKQAGLASQPTRQTTFSTKAKGPGQDLSWAQAPNAPPGAARIAGSSTLQLQHGDVNVAGVGRPSSQAAAAVDAYNAQLRGKSLMEQHAEKKASKEKKRKGSSSTAGGDKDDDWDRTKHARRPFDREKDLQIGGGKGANAEEMIKNLKSLKNKFGSSSGRTFL